MPDIISVLLCLSQCLDKATLRQLGYIVPALLAMTGRVTMLGISRWTDKGGSYRTIQPIFQQRDCLGESKLVFHTASSTGWARYNFGRWR